jgi:cytochrome c5
MTANPDSAAALHDREAKVPRLPIAWAVAIVLTAPAAQHALAATDAERSGEQIVATQCSKCHQTGEGGAPRIGDREAWTPRLKEGLDKLVRSAIRGHGAMPARGGMADTTDAEISRAIVYMFNPRGTASAKTPSAAATPPATSTRQGRRVTVGGMDVYLGVASADVLRAYPAGSAERSMHGGVPRGPGHYHVNVSLFDASSGIAIDDAQVEVDIAQAGTSTGSRKLEVMMVNNAPSYGTYVDMKSGASYVVTVRIRRPELPRIVEAKFQHRTD